MLLVAWTPLGRRTDDFELASTKRGKLGDKASQRSCSLPWPGWAPRPCGSKGGPQQQESSKGPRAPSKNPNEGLSRAL